MKSLEGVMIRIKNTLLLITLLFVTACGYHLRGSIDLPEGLKNIFLQGASSQLTKITQKSLKASGGQLVDSIEQAGIVIRIDKEKMQRRAFSLSASGRANEYELTYILELMFLDAKGKSLAKKQKIELNRNYFNNQEEVLGKSNEEEVIRTEMYRQAVQSIINRSRIALEKVENDHAIEPATNR